MKVICKLQIVMPYLLVLTTTTSLYHRQINYNNKKVFKSKFKMIIILYKLYLNGGQLVLLGNSIKEID